MSNEDYLSYVLRNGIWTRRPVAPPPDPPDEPEEPHTMMVGLDPSMNGVDSANTLKQEIVRVAGTLGIDMTLARPIGNHMKFYDYGNGLAAAAGRYEGSDYRGVPVLCHKVDNKSHYEARLDKITKPEVWVYWQEKGYKKGPSDATYNAAYLHMDQVRRSHPNGHLVELCMDGSGSQERQQLDAQPNFDPAAAHVEYIGLDCYRYGGKGTVAPQKQFKEVHDWHLAVVGTYPEYKGFTVPEFGLGRENGAGVTQDEDARAAELDADFQWLQDKGCIWVNYWEEDNPRADGNSHYWACAPTKVTRDVLNSWITREVLN